MTVGPGSEETLQKVLDRYNREGYVGQFGSRPLGQLRCFSCNEDMDPAGVRLHALHRLEGASDPSDEVAVAALECPNCSSKGTIALRYGPMASQEDAIVLKALWDRRHKADIRSGV